MSDFDTSKIALARGRRAALRLIISSTMISAKVWGAQPQTFEQILAELSSSPDLTAPMRRRDELDGSQPGLEKAPLRSAKSSVPIAAEARDLIIASEISNRAVYEKLYQRPVWPKGKSGLTIGVGYDVGYVNSDQLKADWAPYMPLATIRKLSEACGITGTAAAAVSKSSSDVVVSWDEALQQFDREAQPRYVGLTRAALPKPEQLNGKCLGALVSLVYNRGAAFRLEGDRYSEMRSIKDQMAAGELEKIPGELRKMKRLWEGQPDMRGVVLRREAEALLFQAGLRQKG